MAKRKFICFHCEYHMDIPFDVARPSHCPVCNGVQIVRTEEYSGHTREGGKVKGRGWRRRVRSWGSWKPKVYTGGRR